MSPCGWRGSATGCEVLAGDGVQVGAQTFEVDPGRAPERRHRCSRTDEPIAPQGGKLPDGHTVPGHDEGLAAVELAHDLSAVVAQLPLSDLGGHEPSVALRATTPQWAKLSTCAYTSLSTMIWSQNSTGGREAAGAAHSSPS